MSRTRFHFHFHYPWMLAIGVLVFLGALSFFYLRMFHVSDGNRREYERLTKESDPSIVESADRTPYTATQERLGLQKDIFFNAQPEFADGAVSQDPDLGFNSDVSCHPSESRLHLRLQSSQAKLVLDHGQQGIELVEHMQNVSCLMQEELYYLLPDSRQAVLQPNGKLLLKHADPHLANSWFDKNLPGVKTMQTIRYFEAQNACYYYKSDRFYAHDVSVSRYAIPGHTLTESISGFTPMMEGMAKSIEFSLSGKNLNLKAEQLNAVFHGDGEGSALSDKALQIASGAAEYSGNILTLTEEASVEHDLGSISAAKVVIYPYDIDKKFRIGSLSMEGKVKVKTKQGAELACGKAELDYRTMVGKFFASTPGDYVSYNENCKDRRDNKVPLELKSRTMALNLVREQSKNESPTKWSIGAVCADEDVSVNYNNRFQALADAAVFQRKPDTSNNSIPSQFMGLITLRKSDKGVCQACDSGGDLVKAEEIRIDTNKRTIVFDLPRGGIHAAAGEKGTQDFIEFSAEGLLWDDNRDLLSLQKNVKVSQKGLGDLSAANQIDLYHVVKDNKKQLRAIESKGTTILTRQDESKDLSHTLTCYGKVFVDHQKHETIMESPVDQYGKTLEGKQIYFADDMGEIWADKLKVVYKEDDQTFVPVKVILVGNVKIIDRKPLGADGQSLILHYALADAMEYELQTKVMLFKAFKKRRVLLYDKVNTLQVSAPALKIKRDESTKKEAIEGIGDVRLNFAEHEFEVLRKQFSLDLEQKKE